MQIPIYHIDAFTNAIFSGNPGAVCVLPEWIHDDQLHAIAKENNLPVTAFLVRKVEHYEIRWITPEYELDLCGHGSLCAGYVIFNILEPSIQQAKLKSRIEIIAEIDRIEAALSGTARRFWRGCTLLPKLRTARATAENSSVMRADLPPKKRP